MRVGLHVLRPSNPSSQSVFAFLRHLRAAGFGGVPQPVGIDADGRERLEFIAGDAPWLRTRSGPWRTAVGVGRGPVGPSTALEVFDSTDPGLSWNDEIADARGGPIVCHNDICLENVVFRDGVAVGLLDFDFSAPSGRWLTREGTQGVGHGDDDGAHR